MLDPKKLPWVHITERLPETGERIWFARPQTVGPSIVDAGIFRHGIFRGLADPGGPGWSYSVSHWMPCEIPEPPEPPGTLTIEHPHELQVRIQKVVIRDPKDPAVRCDCYLASCGPCYQQGAGRFMLEGWPDSIVLCERCELNNHVHDDKEPK